MKNKHTKCSIGEKASGTNNCPYRCTHTNTKHTTHKAKRNTKQI